MKKRPSLFFTFEVILFILFIPVLINLLFLDYQVVHPFLMKKQPQSTYQSFPKKQIIPTPILTPMPTIVNKIATRSAAVVHVK